jgi:peptide/nickel transport system permease protein
MIQRRVITSLVTIWGCTVLVFAFRYLLPGGPAQVMIGGTGGGGDFGTTTAHSLKVLEHRLGLDRPLVTQYFSWLNGLIHGNLGTSYYSQEPVTTVLKQRLVPSLQLIIGALIVILVLAFVFGIYAAIRNDRAGGRAVIAISGLGVSVPDFWVGTIAAGVLGLELHIFPAVGYTPLSGGLWANLHSIILPVLILSIVGGAFMIRHLHSSMTAALRSPYIRTAWAMGLPPRQVYLNCALRNALGPVLTFVPFIVFGLIGGTVLVEYIFNIPGEGSEILSSVSNQDYPVIQAIVLLVAVIVGVLNILADVAYALVDPRVRRSV